MSGRAGFTLLELAVTMAIVAILLATGLPSMQELLLDARRTRVVNEVLRALHSARAESLRSASDVVVCPRGDGDACMDEAEAWQRGWMVFVNTDGDDPPVRDPDERLVLRHDLDTTGTVSANRAVFVYRPHVRRATAGTIIYCDRRGAADARAVIVSYTGRPRVAAESATGRPLTCPG